MFSKSRFSRLQNIAKLYFFKKHKLGYCCFFLQKIKNGAQRIISFYQIPTLSLPHVYILLYFPRWSLDSVSQLAFVLFYVDPMHYLWDLQVLFSVKTILKLGSMALFTHLKIILLQCFQFSAISSI